MEGKKKEKFRHAGRLSKRIFRTAGVLAAAALIARMGKAGVEADRVEQDSWHLLCAKTAEEGIAVEIAGENLMLHSGVKVKADSQEGQSFSAAKVRDGICDETDLRWSSENDWENNEHWLEVSFQETETVGFVRIYWERNNAAEYALEYSQDQKSWNVAAKFNARPESTVQDIRLEYPVEAKYLRLHVTAVAKEEADLSLYYQNVSVLELEVYEGIEDSFLIEKPEIPGGSFRQLVPAKKMEDAADEQAKIRVEYPAVPEGYRLTFVGADYEMLVDSSGRIADTIADTQAELGFALEKDGVSRELPGMTVEIPAESGAAGAENEDFDFPVMEWKSRGGVCSLAETSRVVFRKAEEEELAAAAELFARELSSYLGREVEALAVDDFSGEGDICLALLEEEGEASAAAWNDGLGAEGYEIWIGGAAQKDEHMSEGEEPEEIRICANTVQGVRWGCVTLLSLLEKTQGELPEGQIRDYPRYSVRGFGIDVGRRPVSLELLYRIVEEMSAQKMNTLQVHLNDNQIISQSDYDGTVSGARSLYAGFRLESDLKNEAGEGITSSDLFYTKEEFAQFIEDAAAYGVEVVPEIDTPAHSLAFTKVFPELGLSRNPESADQLDLSNPEAVELGKALWSEYLTGEDSVFGGCQAVHIGMDEYFGDGEDYISYLLAIADHVGTLAPDKEIRIWGSLSLMDADHAEVSTSLQMHIWDTSWADPQDMYDEGFSIINSLSSSLYIIPGGGYDWLDQDFLTGSWQPNVFETRERTWTIPAYSPKMLGACYMMWNDWWQANGESLTEEDLFARFERPLEVIAGKLWGGK
ncbi:MAG: family 20 glycosylhydrolase [Eubacteriales bacterium]|nr:family 20 glycosylhydrolase [Eubacteriales bacterium]